MTDHTHKLWQY